jgi:hypothetical protein
VAPGDNDNVRRLNTVQFPYFIGVEGKKRTQTFEVLKKGTIRKHKAFRFPVTEIEKA